MAISAEAIAPLTDERRRLLTNQIAFTDTIRNRTTAMLTVASIVAGVFGANLISGSSSHPKPVLASIAGALLLFAITVCLSIRVMRLRDFHTGANVDVMLRRVAEDDAVVTAAAVNVTLARQYLDAFEKNATNVERMNDWYSWVCILVAAQVIAWALAAFWP